MNEDYLPPRTIEPGKRYMLKVTEVDTGYTWTFPVSTFMNFDIKQTDESMVITTWWKKNAIPE